MTVIHWSEWGNWTTACGVGADGSNEHTDRPSLVSCPRCAEVRLTA